MFAATFFLFLGLCVWFLLILRSYNQLQESLTALDAAYARAHDYVLVLLTLAAESQHASKLHIDRVSHARLKAHAGLGARRSRAVEQHWQYEANLRSEMKAWLEQLITTPDSNDPIILDILQHYHQKIIAVAEAESYTMKLANALIAVQRPWPGPLLSRLAGIRPVWVN